MTARANIGVLLRSEDSGGRVSLVDNRVPAGTAGPPLHRHDFDEAFVVLEGEVTFQLGDDLMTRRAGEVAFAPRGVPHTFANQSGADARHVIVITPRGSSGTSTGWRRGRPGSTRPRPPRTAGPR